MPEFKFSHVSSASASASGSSAAGNEQTIGNKRRRNLLKSTASAILGIGFDAGSSHSFSNTTAVGPQDKIRNRLAAYRLRKLVNPVSTLVTPASGGGQTNVMDIDDDNNNSDSGESSRKRHRRDSPSRGITRTAQTILEVLSSPNASVPVIPKASVSSSSMFAPGFGPASDAAAGKIWKCDCCFAENKDALDKCACCEAVKPATGQSKAIPAAASPSKIASQPVPSKAFTFGAPSGGAATSKKDADLPSAEISRPSGGFTFGSASNQGSLFTFGTSAPAKSPKKSDTSSAIPVSVAPSLSMFAPGFGPASSAKVWNCTVCLSENKDNLDKCAACEEPKPGAKKSETVAPPTLGSMTSGGFKFGTPSTVAPVVLSGTMFAPGFGPSSSMAKIWKCDGCFAENKDDIEKCACCEAPKPGSVKAGPAQPSFSGSMTTGGFKFGSSSSTNSLPVQQSQDSHKSGDAKVGPTMIPAASPVSISVPPPTSSSMFAPGFGPASSAKVWNCTVCLSENKDELVKCAACEEPRPGAKKSETTTASSLGSMTTGGFKFGSSSSTNSLHVQPSQNSHKSGDVKIGSAMLPAVSPVSNSVPPPTSSSMFAPGFGPASSAKVWNCTVCLSENKDELVKCAACEEPKPGAKKSETTTAPSLGSMTSAGFKFGAMPVSSDAKSAFGKPSSETTTGNKSGFQVGTVPASQPTEPLKGFNFTAPISSVSAAKPITFGSTAPSTGTTSTGFKFGPVDNSSDTSKGFNFDRITPSAPEKSPGFSFGSSGSATNTPVVSFTATLPADAGVKAGNKINLFDTGKSSPKAFSFGSAKSAQPSALPQFTPKSTFTPPPVVIDFTDETDNKEKQDAPPQSPKTSKLRDIDQDLLKQYPFPSVPVEKAGTELDRDAVLAYAKTYTFKT